MQALAGHLKKDYQVVSLDFQNIESAEFKSGSTFVHALTREITKKIRRLSGVPDAVKEKLGMLADTAALRARMAEMFACFSEWCELSEKPVVLLIDEVDTAENNQVFLDFLAQLRAGYLDRNETSSFQSVILAGVYDVRSIKSKIRPSEEHKENSPWNIAADFDVNMSFPAQDIAGMLENYEAEKMIVKEDNTLYQSMIRKLKLYPKLRTVLYELLFTGKPIPYVATNDYIKDAAMFGFIRNEKDTAVIFND